MKSFEISTEKFVIFIGDYQENSREGPRRKKVNALVSWWQTFLWQSLSFPGNASRAKALNRGIFDCPLIHCFFGGKGLTFCFYCIKLLKEFEMAELECDSKSHGKFLYGRKQSVFTVLYELYNIIMRVEGSAGGREFKTRYTCS
jgi:hypothetical protein